MTYSYAVVLHRTLKECVKISENVNNLFPKYQDFVSIYYMQFVDVNSGITSVLSIFNSNEYRGGGIGMGRSLPEPQSVSSPGSFQIL